MKETVSFFPRFLMKETGLRFSQIFDEGDRLLFSQIFVNRINILLYGCIILFLGEGGVGEKKILTDFSRISHRFFADFSQISRRFLADFSQIVLFFFF